MQKSWLVPVLLSWAITVEMRPKADIQNCTCLSVSINANVNNTCLDYQEIKTVVQIFKLIKPRPIYLSSIMVSVRCAENGSNELNI